MKEEINGEKLASIRKSGLEIKNRCTQEGLNRQNRASIPKSGPEIKNRCRKQPIFSTHPRHIPQHIPQHIPCTSPARVHHALKTRLALDVLHGGGYDAGSTVAAKAGADAPGGGISLCFCRRGCAAPAQKAATLNASASPAHTTSTSPAHIPSPHHQHTPAHIPALPGSHPAATTAAGVQSFIALGV